MNHYMPIDAPMTPAVRDVIEAVAAEWGLKFEHIFRRKGNHAISHARQEAMRRLYALGRPHRRGYKNDYSSYAISHLFGVNHETVLHAINHAKRYEPKKHLTSSTKRS